MRPSRILRNLSLKFLRSSIAVPLPIPTSFNQRISQQLEGLNTRGGDNFNSSWLLHALESSIAIQRFAQECLANIVCKQSHRDAINIYLDDNIELIDACSIMLEKMDVLFNYSKSLHVVLHMLEGGFESNLIGLGRAKEALNICVSLEKQFRDMSKSCSYNSRLIKRLNDKYKFAQRGAKSSVSSSAKNINVCLKSELEQLLNGSFYIVSLVCEVVNTALSFKSKKSSSFLDQLQKMIMIMSKEETHQKQKKRGDSSSSILLKELRRTVNASQLLREQMKTQNCGEICETVEELKRSCEEFGKFLNPLKKE